MKESELKAMISLLDDPDQEIFQEIEHNLITCGPEVIPLLEKHWEESFDVLLQTRIEDIIDKIQFDQIKNELQLWRLHNSEDLLEGLLIINRYQYPSMDEEQVYFILAELKRNAWFHMMYDMSPLEKVKLLNNVIFREFGLSGNTTDYHSPSNSYIQKVLETKKGNPISLACVYALVAEKLDIPIYGINLPKHFVLAYMDQDVDAEQKVLFYINVFNRGQIMKEDDILSFLRQLNLPLTEEYTLPCSNVDIIKRVLRNLISAYENQGSLNKKQDIEVLLKLIEE
ncbi:transglutaminase-like domain-containing protein [Sphingobacterium hungaricum]|uniref:Protein SirB1 N-terminal domain-containing protein n=1 Tax=Sphingobacterium hungaricum TaxID=2082723 RepID=A0A928UZK1_9SPHI|nr:transglutaminase-like domain-containing protein [Sphingobacterium hungaricum]MBE8715567.1 hypothetical protein [Sphingobacterium hungaricum]